MPDAYWDSHWYTTLTYASNTTQSQQIRTLFVIILTTWFLIQSKISTSLVSNELQPGHAIHRICVMKRWFPLRISSD